MPRRLIAIGWVCLLSLPAFAGTIRGTVASPPGPNARAAAAADGCFWRLGPLPAHPAEPSLVVLEGAAAPAPAEPTAELSLAGFGFQPAFQAVTAGTRLTIRNLDPRQYSCSASGASSFQIETLAAGQSVTQTLGSEGIVEVRCHGYPFSRATILVVARGLWAAPDAEGKFVFANVPAGEYRARLFADRSWHFESPVAVTAQGTIQLMLGAPQTLAGESPGEAKKPPEAAPPAPPPEPPKPAAPSAPPVAARPVENKPPPAPPAPKSKPAEPKPKPDKPAPKEPAGGFSDVEPEVEVEVE